MYKFHQFTFTDPFFEMHTHGTNLKANNLTYLLIINFTQPNGKMDERERER